MKRVAIRPPDKPTGFQMRITCPECESGFDVPDNAIPEKGRKLKCSQCQHKWHQKPIVDEPAPKAKKPAPKQEPVLAEEAPPPPEQDAGDDAEIDFGDGSDEAASDGDENVDFSMFGGGELDPDAEDDFDAPPIPRRRPLGAEAKPSRRGRYAAIAAAVVFLLIIPGGLVGARAPLVSAVPAISPLFDAIGLHVPVPGEDLIIQNVGAWRKTEGGVERMLIQGEIRNDTDRMQSVPVLRAVIEDAAGAELQSAPYTPEAALLVPGDVLSFAYEIPNPGPNAARVTVSFSEEARQGGFGY
ncbi:MAG: zinc-ribbon domain-containing protein [Alphaproteobacteria bacterium]|jgi:predicted Zn finger-like uncharacterized protein|nr:zinc-ribbon domain-containing protein [Alphaproteobacteria bacterium]